MLRRVRVLAGMPVGRTVAATRPPALLAGAQVYPLRAYLQAVIPATITDIGELPATPTRMSFSAVCSGVNVSCSIMNGVLGPGALWALLPPIFDLNAGSSASLRRAAQSIRGIQAPCQRALWKRRLDHALLGEW
jgi:hypothetical protein